MGCYTLKYRDYEDIGSVQTVGLHCGWAGKAEESWVLRGNSLHRCCCFQRQNGELRNANGPDSYRSCFPTRSTVRVNKEEEAVKTFMVFDIIFQLNVGRRLSRQPRLLTGVNLSSAVITLHIETRFLKCQITTWFT